MASGYGLAGGTYDLSSQWHDGKILKAWGYQESRESLGGEEQEDNACMQDNSI
jgi:hypothetical protein